MTVKILDNNGMSLGTVVVTLEQIKRMNSEGVRFERAYYFFLAARAREFYTKARRVSVKWQIAQILPLIFV